MKIIPVYDSIQNKCLNNVGLDVTETNESKS